MGDKVVLRVGSWAAIIGGVLAVVVNVVAPRPGSADFGDAQAYVDLAKGTSGWELLELGIVVALLVLLAAFYAVTKSIDDAPASSWARLGLGAAIVGTAVGVVAFAVQLPLKAAAEAFGSDSVTAAHMLVFGLFPVWGFVYFGLVGVLYGYALKLSHSYPDWLGWLAMVAGLAGLAFGIIQPLSGESTLTTFVLFPIASGLMTLIIIYLGVLLGRKVSAAS